MFYNFINQHATSKAKMIFYINCTYSYCHALVVTDFLGLIRKTSNNCLCCMQDYMFWEIVDKLCNIVSSRGDIESRFWKTQGFMKIFKTWWRKQNTDLQFFWNYYFLLFKITHQQLPQSIFIITLTRNTYIGAKAYSKE